MLRRSRNKLILFSITLKLILSSFFLQIIIIKLNNLVVDIKIKKLLGNANIKGLCSVIGGIFFHWVWHYEPVGKLFLI